MCHLAAWIVSRWSSTETTVSAPAGSAAPPTRCDVRMHCIENRPSSTSSLHTVRTTGSCAEHPAGALSSWVVPTTVVDSMDVIQGRHTVCTTCTYGLFNSAERIKCSGVEYLTCNNHGCNRAVPQRMLVSRDQCVHQPSREQMPLSMQGTVIDHAGSPAAAPCCG